MQNVNINQEVENAMMAPAQQPRGIVDLLASELKARDAKARNQLNTMMAPAPNPNTIISQNEKETENNVRQEITQKMQSMAVKENQNKARMNQALAGIAGQRANNMTRMANGGIIGYQEGGFMGPPEPNLYQRIGQGLKNYGTNAQESMDILRAAKAGIGVPYGNRSAAIQQVRDQIAAEKQNRDPNFIQRMGQKLMDTGLDVEESKAILKKFYDNIGKTYEQKASGMAQGGIIGYNSRGSVDLLDAALEAEGITDPATIALIRSIYAQESSSGQNTGISPAGARGPMQVMPGTFAEMMGSDADINDPMTNLRAGSRYAQQMLARAEGDPRLAAAGYYGGSGGMDKLRAGNDTEAPQNGFPNISTYADEVVARMSDSGRTPQSGTSEDKMRELGLDPDYGLFDFLGEPFQILGDKFKQGSLAAAEFLGDVMPGGGSVGRERMAEQKATEAVEAAYPDASPGDVRAITKMIMVNDEELPPPAVDTDRVRAEQYMGSDQQVDDMMSDIYRGVEPEAPAPKGDGLAGLAKAMAPSRLQELRNRRKGIMSGITSPERLQRDKLRAYLSGLGQTGLGGGAEAFTREQQRQDALQIGDLDRLIELEREDEKLQREIDASMAELVANNLADLEQLMVEAGLEEQMSLAGDRRKFIADVLKEIQKESVLNPELMALEKARQDGDITSDEYATQSLAIYKRAMGSPAAGYDIETGLGGGIDFTSGTFD